MHLRDSLSKYIRMQRTFRQQSSKVFAGVLPVIAGDCGRYYGNVLTMFIPSVSGCVGRSRWLDTHHVYNVMDEHSQKFTMNWMKFIRMNALLEIFKKGVQLAKATEGLLKKLNVHHILFEQGEGGVTMLGKV